VRISVTVRDLIANGPEQLSHVANRIGRHPANPGFLDHRDQRPLRGLVGSRKGGKDTGLCGFRLCLFGVMQGNCLRKGGKMRWVVESELRVPTSPWSPRSGLCIRSEESASGSCLSSVQDPVALIREPPSNELLVRHH
jgi:hypothetical protein